MDWNPNGLSDTAGPSVNISTAQDGSPAVYDAIDVNVDPLAITIPVG